MFAGVRKLAPASVLVWQHGRAQEEHYWRLETTQDHSLRSPQDCVAETRRLLGRAVQKQLVSDVPLGLYLSGGIDSSALVALAAQATDQVKTFSLGFNEPTDELPDARRVSRAFGTQHHETTIQFDALSVFPRVTWHVEEPKENAIQLYLLSQFASQHVTVALSGLGGDELFGGYRIFDYFRPTLPFSRLISRQMNAAVLWPARNILSLISHQFGSMRFDLARRGIDYVLSLGVPERSYLLLRNMWEHDRRLFCAIYTPDARQQIERGVEAYFHPFFQNAFADVREEVLRAELAFKMVDDFLMNEDRTSMAHSLEVRVPFLDKDLVEFAFAIPTPVKFAGGGLKTVLKAAMADVLPSQTLTKPKWGFTFDPFYQFQKDLRDLARAELTPNFIRQQGIFNYSFLQAILDHPPHRWLRWHYFLLWLILGVKVWQQLFIHGRSPDACYETGPRPQPDRN